MDDAQLRRKHRLLFRLLGPMAAAAAEEQSKAWIVHCPHCGFERSLWDTGGIRYKASGDNSWVWIRCPSCGKTVAHRVTKGPDYPTDTGPTWPLVRLIMGLVFLILLAVAALLLLAFRIFGLL